MSEQSGKRFELRRDGLGILLFTVGAFLAVLIALALSSSEPLEKAEGTAAIARLFARTIGLAPGLVASAGCAVLGARLFLAGGAGGAAAWKNVGRIALVAVGLSALLGAFSATAGGAVGALTAGAVAHATNGFVGAIAGLVALAAAVWASWGRSARAARKDVDTAPVGSALSASDHGVSAEEAAALIPEDLTPRRAAPRMDSPVTESPSPATPVRPENARRRGEIPEGARLLDPTHAHSVVARSPVESEPEPSPSISGLSLSPLRDELAPAALHDGVADPEGLLAADGADEDLAAEEELGVEAVEIRVSGELDGPVEPVLAAGRGLEAPHLIEVEAFEREVFAAEAFGAEDLELDPLDDEEEEPEALDIEDEELTPEEVGEVEVAAEEVASVPRPSWEQSSLFDAEGEPPVDAYGTPLEEEPLSEEEDVILTPQPPKKKKRKPARQPAPADARSQLLAEIGCLLVERGRVAVSMLQKQYDMDFDEATRVLDELQALGLIGPYLGGQRRDILLTRDEWLEKVSSL